MKFAEGCIYLWSVSSLVAQQFQTRALPLIAVALVINTKPGAALVVMSMVPHHSNGLLNERSPRHGAIKDHILLLVDCRTYLISKTNSAKQSLKESSSKSLLRSPHSIPQRQGDVDSKKMALL